MNKIINGRKYDTDTAKEVACYDNGYACNDLQHYSETLYRKKTKEFFLYAEGGAMTCCAKSIGYGWQSGGSSFKPLSDNEAKEWVTEHCDATHYEEVFGIVEE